MKKKKTKTKRTKTTTKITKLKPWQRALAKFSATLVKDKKSFIITVTDLEKTSVHMNGRGPDLALLMVGVAESVNKHFSSPDFLIPGTAKEQAHRQRHGTLQGVQ